MIETALVVGALAMSACTTAPSYKAADCDRFRFRNYNVLACDDESVGRHCKAVANKYGSLSDSGKPVTYHPRACHITRPGGRKPNIVIGRSYMSCLAHEICHNENPWDAAKCEREYPCVGDKRTK